jgi:hypothetical protein
VQLDRDPCLRCANSALRLGRPSLTPCLPGAAALSRPAGVVVVSHDRCFLDRVATHILAFEGDSKVTFFEGNYAEYEEDYIARVGVEGSQPKPLKFAALAA